MTWLSPSLREDEEMWTQVEKMNASRAMAAAQVTPEKANNIEALHQGYDWLDTGTKVSLGQAGVKPDDPIMKPVAEAAVEKKKKKGFGWHSFGDAVKAGFSNTAGKVLEGVGAVGGAAWDVVDDPIKGAVRTGFMALEAPVEETVGLLRNVAVTLPGKAGEFVAGAASGAITGGLIGAAGWNPITIGAGIIGGAAIGGTMGLLSEDVQGEAQWTTQSKLGIATGRLIAGKEVDTGEGYFVGHDTGLFKMQADRARAVASLEGPDGTRSAWTPGRSVANVVAEPGSLQHKALSGVIDGYLNFKGDPTALAMAKRAKIVAARKTLDPVKAAEFIASKAGDDLAQAVAAEKRGTKISELFNHQLDDHPEILVSLMDETDPIKIKQLLEPVLGVNVSEIPKFVQKRSVVPRLMEAAGKPVTARLKDSRLLSDVPTGMWEYDKPAEAMKKFSDFLKIGKVDEAKRLDLEDEFIRSFAGGKAGRMPVLKNAMGALHEVAIANGASNEAASRITRLFNDSIEEARHYTAMAISDQSTLNDLPWMKLAGDKHSVQSPHDIAEFLNHGVPIPDMIEVKRTISKLNNIVGHPLTNVAHNTIDAMDGVMGAWKRMAILRAAYMPRVIGEEQVRMATAGFDSIFKHPISFIAGRVAAKKGATPVLNLEGVPLAAQDDVAHALNQGRGSEVLARSGTRYKGRVRLTVNDGEDIYRAGWKGHELDHIARSPLMSRIADAMLNNQSVDDIGNAFAHGKDPGLRKLRNSIAETLKGTADELWFDDPANARKYYDSLVERVTQFTRNDPKLLEAASRGLDNVEGVDDAMKALIAADNMPPMVVGDKWGQGLADDTRKLFDKVTDAGFEWIARKPTNFMSRSPVLEQAYWKNVERMLPAMDPADQQKVISLAEQSKLPKARIAEIKRSAQTPFSGNKLTMEDVHDVAASQASTTVKKLLYDLSAKKQWAQASRLVFPFAEAWQEMMTTWGKLLVQNPVALRRGQQVVEGARGAGFFHTDQYGQEVFTYPGSAFITSKLVGAPIGINASVGGLNLFAQSPVLPGFGPVAQIGASALLPDKPEFDWVQDMISPYGRGETESGFVESFLPSWVQKARKVMTSDESDRVFNNTVYDMARYLVSSGRGDLSTVEGQEQLTQDAISMAKRMYVLRTLGSFALPSAPQPEMVAEDKDGRVMTQFALMEEYRALQQEPGVTTKVGNKTITGVGWEEAPEVFLETFGEDALLFMQPKTEGSGSPLEDTLDWVRNNPDLAKRYKNTYQYFAPHAGEFSMTAYERQIATGERKALTPDEAYKRANARVADMQYRKAKEMLGPKPSDAQREWLRQVKEALVDEYPGFVPEKFDPSKTPVRIRELEDAMEDPKLADTDTGQALKTYFQARQMATESAQAGGVDGFGRAKSARPVREWLRQVATALIEEHPSFAEVWDQVLSREMVSDDEPVAEIPQ